MTTVSALFKTYAPASAFDELLQADKPKAHWEAFIREFGRLSPEELEQASSEIRRHLKENGVTYNTHGQEGQGRAWLLDLMPSIYSQDEWQLVSRGVKQRAQLFKLILDDCYGTQELIKEKIIPLELIYNHRGFLLPSHGLKHDLSFYATDLARGADGKMWVLNDRAQAPSGVGFALENRTVISSVFPHLFQSSQVARLSSFFRDMQGSFASLSPRQGGEANIVILSPGPRSETFFEHAYLGSYLGYNVVQGDDLTVRDGYVYLKTIEGLEQVDVIVRRLDDYNCDSLELNGSSSLGTPGLLEAVRRGTVRVANSIGSSLLENPGLLPFLPSIADYFLGEALILPSVASWWCGQAAEKDYVLANLERLVIKRISRQNKRQTVFGAGLDEEALAQLRAQIRAEGHLFVAQEVLEHGTSPTLDGGRLEPRHTLLRCFAVQLGETYSVMPGGLSRSSARLGSVLINNRAGGTSKDTWVLTDSPQEHISLWQEGYQAEDYLPSQLASRTADNLFWVGRYAERAEAFARLLRSLFQVLNELSGKRSSQDRLEWSAFGSQLEALGKFSLQDLELNSKAFAKLQKKLFTLTLAHDHPSGLAANLGFLFAAAYGVKSAWSSDSWRVLDACQDLWREEKTSKPQAVSSKLNDLISLLMAFAGLNSESMSQGLGWRFLDMGRRIERARMMIKLLDAMLVPVFNDLEEDIVLERLLSTTENIISYRRRYRRILTVKHALELVLFDEANPRAVGFQLRRLEEHQRQLPRSKGYTLSVEEKLLIEVTSRLRLADSLSLSQARSKERSSLKNLLAQLLEGLEHYAVVLTGHYFSHTQVAVQLKRQEAG
ncbi:MAG: circularly permuted type 2 ATP-grasp protein [Trueperaceae bacterium]|nr:circularly permuted type 2 ATP-grasp protein [Trueperaceae bacterium]